MKYLSCLQKSKPVRVRKKVGENFNQVSYLQLIPNFLSLRTKPTEC